MIFSIDVNNFKADKSFSKKTAMLSIMKNENARSYFIGIGDSKQDLDFIKLCDEGFLVKNDALIRVK